jgi:uncharacterized protein
MNGISQLNVAKLMLGQKRFPEAIGLFKAIVNENSEASPEAAYCLGILYQSGNGVQKSVEEAERYYLIAEQSRYTMATYRLAGIYHRSGELPKAYASYRSIAQNNPSAAYWTYRLLMSDKSLDSNPGAGETYLNSAADQGHVLAQRITAIEHIYGRRGLLKIPVGLYLFLKMACNSVQAASRGEKLKYE